MAKLAASWNWPTQTQWITYFDSMRVGGATRLGQNVLADNGRGIVAHIQPGSSLPPGSDMRAMIDVWHNQGLKVYMSFKDELHMSAAELSERQTNWNKADTRWDGLIVNAESVWENYATTNPAPAEADLRAFVTSFRTLLGGRILGYAPYSNPRARPGYHYEWWNELFDVCLPQIYFATTPYSTALDKINWSRNQFSKAAEPGEQNWPNPVGPIIPLQACWGSNALSTSEPSNLQFGTISLERYDHVSWWRYGAYPGTTGQEWPPWIETEVFRALPATLSPPPPPPPPTSTGSVVFGKPTLSGVATVTGVGSDTARNPCV